LLAYVKRYRCHGTHHHPIIPQQSPNAESRQVYPFAPPQVASTETFKVLLGAAALDDTPEGPAEDTESKLVALAPRNGNPPVEEIEEAPLVVDETPPEEVI
jgi:hypothetical protein